MVGVDDPGHVLEPAELGEAALITEHFQRPALGQGDCVRDDDLGDGAVICSEPLSGLPTADSMCCCGPDVICSVASQDLTEVHHRAGRSDLVIDHGDHSTFDVLTSSDDVDDLGLLRADSSLQGDDVREGETELLLDGLACRVVTLASAVVREGEAELRGVHSHVDHLLEESTRQVDGCDEARPARHSDLLAVRICADPAVQTLGSACRLGQLHQHRWHGELLVTFILV